MVLKLNPNHQMVWRTPMEAQIGFGRNQVRLSELSVEQEKFIDALYLGLAPNQVEAVARQSRLALEQAKKIVEQLEPLMLRKLANPNDQPTGIDVDRAFAEIARASLLTASDGEAVLLQRARRMVYIDKLDSTGLLLMNALAAAGVGAIITEDNAAVLNKDVGPAGYPIALMTKKRVASAQLILQSNHSATQIVGPPRVRPKHIDNADFAVITGSQLLDPKQYSPWTNRQTSHLAIVFDAVGAWSSGVIRSGLTPCLYCEYLGRLADDDAWAAVATQLISSSMRFDDQATKLLAVGLAVQDILAELDRIGGFGIESTPNHRAYRVDRELAKVSEFSWARQEKCSCELLAQQVPQGLVKGVTLRAV